MYCWVNKFDGKTDAVEIELNDQSQANKYLLLNIEFWIYKHCWLPTNISEYIRFVKRTYHLFFLIRKLRNYNNYVILHSKPHFDASSYWFLQHQ